MINKEPYIEIVSNQDSCWEGWESIAAELKREITRLDKKKVVICVECYQGTYADFNLEALKDKLSPNVTCKARDIYKDEIEIRQLVKKDISISSTSKLSTNTIEDYFDQEKLESLRNNIDFIEEGIILIHGIGSHKIWTSDIIVYSDMSRYEILQRFRRNDISNIGVENENDAFESQHKWSYFIDWRICDKLKKQLLVNCDYFLETNNWVKPKLATGQVVRKALEEATTQPFFMAKFFDPELWDSTDGSKNSSEDDFSWGFDCDMEQNNVLLKLGNHLFETPAINILYYKPQDLLGASNYRKYGSEMPIRFNFIDNMDSNNLLLRMYPSSDFLKDHFGINLSQNDNFYIMDTGSRPSIYLGLKEEISTEYFKDYIWSGVQKSAITKLLRKIKVKKHDHIFIPSEVIHSNGENLMILHISVAPLIFKSALFVQGERQNAFNHLSKERITDLISLAQNTPYDHLINEISKEEDHEKLAPNGNQIIDLQRIWFTEKKKIETNNIVQVFNLIEGEEVVVESINKGFKPFIVHYTETFIIPAGIREFNISPKKGTRFGLLKASTRI